MSIEETVISDSKSVDQGGILNGSIPGTEGPDSSFSVQNCFNTNISAVDENSASQETLGLSASSGDKCADREGKFNGKNDVITMEFNLTNEKALLASPEILDLPVHLDNKYANQEINLNSILVPEKNGFSTLNADIVANEMNLNNDVHQDDRKITCEYQEILDLPINLCNKNLQKVSSADDIKVPQTVVKCEEVPSESAVNDNFNTGVRKILYASKISITERLKNRVPIRYTVDQIKKKKLICESCPKRFEYKSGLQQHMRIHTGERPFPCHVCDKRFMDKKTMERHVRIHTGDKNFSCEICNKAFLEKKNLMQHIVTHTDDKPFVCEVCHKSFKARRDLESHVAIHSGEKPFLCDLCQKRFHSKMALDKHVRIHYNQSQKSKTFICGVCQRAFTNYSSLRDHLLGHTGERPHICGICQSSFTRKSSLNRHLFRHTTEKPFVCECCLKVFSSRSHLAQHAHVHTEAKPFVCHVCQKAFKKRYGLDAHLTVHSGERPHVCNICQSTFTRKSSLRRHLQRHNNGKLASYVDPEVKACNILSHSDDSKLAVATFSESNLQN